MKNINPVRIFLLSSVMALTIIYAGLWVSTLSDPGLRTGSDYMAFYAAGRIAQSAGYEKIYDLSLQQTVEEETLGFEIPPDDVNPFVHPPFIVPLLALLSNLGYAVSFHLWALFLVIIHAASAYVFLLYFPDLSSGDKFWLFAGIMLFYPFFVSIINGQDSAILLLGTAVWILGFIKNDERLAGLGLAFTVIRPHIAILLAAPFLFKRQGIWWWFCAGAGILVVVSLALIGGDGVNTYLGTLAVSAGGEGYKINEAAMVNLLGLLRRTFPSMLPQTARIISWGLYFTAIAGMAVFTMASREIRETHLGLAILAAILATPHLHYHDVVLFLPAIFIVLRALRVGNPSIVKNMKIIVFALGWLLISSSPIPFLKYFSVYALIALLIFLYWQSGALSFPVFAWNEKTRSENTHD